MNGDHDYKDTIKQASDIDDDKAPRSDGDAAYETLAVNAVMSEYGMEETVANLIQLELTQELMYKLDPAVRERREK